MPSSSNPLAPWVTTLWVQAVLCGFMALGGLVMSQMVIVIQFWPDMAPTPQLKQDMLPICTLIASPVGVLMALWKWRVPKSKWVFPVAFCLGSSGFVLGFIFTILFGLE